MAPEYHAPKYEWERYLREQGWVVHPASGYWIDPQDPTTAQPIGEAISAQCDRDGVETPLSKDGGK